jgi:hypothetical protein
MCRGVILSARRRAKNLLLFSGTKQILRSAQDDTTKGMFSYDVFLGHPLAVMLSAAKHPRRLSHRAPLQAFLIKS